MDFALQVLGLMILAFACVIALFSLVLGIPGTFIVFAAGLLYAWLTGFSAVTYETLAWLLGLAVLAEGLEFLSGALGSAKERPSRRTMGWALAGSFIGGIVGTPILFGVGSLLGALAGAFAGAALAVASDGGHTRDAVRSGFAAMRGRFAGFLDKLAICVVLVVVLSAAAIKPRGEPSARQCCTPHVVTALVPPLLGSRDYVQLHARRKWVAVRVGQKARAYESRLSRRQDARRAQRDVHRRGQHRRRREEGRVDVLRRVHHRDSRSQGNGVVARGIAGRAAGIDEHLDGDDHRRRRCVGARDERAEAARVDDARDRVNVRRLCSAELRDRAVGQPRDGAARLRE
jgi:hypothetical protein